MHRSQHPNPLPAPSRMVLNAGILVGGLIGFYIQNQAGSDNTQAFLVTGVCCFIGAFMFSVAEIGWRKRRQSSKK